MKKILSALLVSVMATSAYAQDAVSYFGRDVVFPNKVEGLPQKLSDVKGLQIKEFVTNDKVTLRYWEAGAGKPLIIIPGWSANGAWMINNIALLSKTYHVFVLDPRNQGISQPVDYGNNIARFSMDLNEFVSHIGVDKAYFIGWSMGASVLWGYIDLFGTEKMEKVVFVDEPPSIYSHSDWSEKERLQAGGFISSLELGIASIAGGFLSPDKASATGAAQGVEVNSLEAAWPTMLPETKASENAIFFLKEVVNVNPSKMAKVLYDHMSNDWREVIQHKIDVPTAVFAADDPVRYHSQKWMSEVIPGATLVAHKAKDSGDHDFIVKNPVLFTKDLTAYLNAAN